MCPHVVDSYPRKYCPNPVSMKDAMFMGTLRRAPRAFKVLVASALIENVGFGLVFPVLAIYMVENIGISESLAGVALAGYTLSGIPAMIFGGMLADRIGRRPVLLMSLGLMSITMAMYFFANDFVTLFIIILADSFVGTLYMPAANAMIADVIPPRDRPEAYSTLRIAWNAGIFIGPSIGILIVEVWSIRELFLFGSVILAGAFVMNIFLIPETKPASIVSEEVTFRKTMAVASNKSFLLLCALTGTLWFFLSQWMSVLTIYLKSDLFFSTSNVEVLFAVNGLMVVTLQLWITSRTVRFRRSAVLLSGQVLAALGFSSLFLVDDFAGVLACTVIMTVGELIYMSIIGAIIADMSPEVERGLYMGFAGFMQTLAMGAGMLFGMVTLDIMDEDRFIWLIFGVFGLVTSLGYLVFARMIGPEKNDPAKYGHQPA